MFIQFRKCLKILQLVDILLQVIIGFYSKFDGIITESLYTSILIEVAVNSMKEFKITINKSKYRNDVDFMDLLIFKE